MEKEGRPTGAGDALGMLEEDHRRVLGLFREFDALTRRPGMSEGAMAAEKACLAEGICRELTVHAALEEEVFYPEARASLGDVELMDEAQVEHGCAADLIRRIRDGGEGPLDAEVRVLADVMGRHIREEEKRMFPRVRKAGLDLAAVGARMQERRALLVQGASDRGRRGKAPEAGVGKGKGGERTARKGAMPRPAPGTPHHGPR